MAEVGPGLPPDDGLPAFAFAAAGVRMTECLRGCGQCCDPVFFHLNRLDVVREMALATPENRRTLEFVREHWHQQMSTPPRRNADGKAFWAYTCDQFDPVARDCNAGEGRPPICSGFPRYGRERLESLDEHLTGCTFWNDIPVESWPEGVKPLTRGLLPLTVLDAQAAKDARASG